MKELKENSLRLAASMLLMLFLLGCNAASARAEEPEGAINVKTLGAKGDGVTDDTAILQKIFKDQE